MAVPSLCHFRGCWHLWLPSLLQHKGTAAVKPWEAPAMEKSVTLITPCTAFISMKGPWLLQR